MVNRMIEHTKPKFAQSSAQALPLWLATPENLDDLLATLPDVSSNWVRESGFSAAAGKILTFPDADGKIAGAIGEIGRAHV